MVSFYTLFWSAFPDSSNNDKERYISKDNFCIGRHNDETAVLSFYFLLFLQQITLTYWILTGYVNCVSRIFIIFVG